MATRFTGTKLVCVAKNYAAHKVEMGGTPERLSAPVFFLKPPSCVIFGGAAIVKPRAVKDLHHEVELGVVIGAECRRAAAQDWRRYVGGYVLALVSSSGLPCTCGPAACWGVCGP